MHIPIECYTHYVQALIQVLDPPVAEQPEVERGVQPSHRSVSWINVHLFLNISITPLECSVVCSKDLAQRFFLPAIERLSEPARGTISSEDYVAISVVGEGLDAGQRVLDLSTPLAMAGMYVKSMIMPCVLISPVPFFSLQPISLITFSYLRKLAIRW